MHESPRYIPCIEVARIAVLSSWQDGKNGIHLGTDLMEHIITYVKEEIASHTSKKSYERDLFVEKVYKDANFELIRLSSKYTNKDIETALTGVFDKLKENPVVQENDETILCPKCRIPMVNH